MKKFAFLFTLFIFLSSVTSFAQLTEGQIDSLMDDALKKFKVAGACIAVVKDGKVIHQKGYGVTSVTSNNPVNETTNFQIASNSKAFTSTALAILEDEGKLKWTDKVRDYLPEFQMYDEYVTANFNIHDLLTHRSGMPLGAGDLMWFPDGANFTVKDVLTCYKDFPPVSDFRTIYNYNNLFYIMAGEIVARVSGMSYELFVQQRIIEPLQMNHTFVGNLLKDKTNLALPHSSESGAIKAIENYDIGMASAAAGIFSNAADISKWMMVRLNNGKYGPDLKSSLFSLKNHQEMWRVHTVLPASTDPRYNAHFRGYGLGWDITDAKGNLKISHTGGLPGMLSKVTLYPDMNLGIAVFTNTENGGAGLFTAVSNTIADSYLGLNEYGWTGKLVSRMEQQRSMGDSVTNAVWKKVEVSKNKKINYADFTGIYEDSWFGKVEIFEKDKQLYIKSHRSSKLNGPMYFYHANTFAVKWEYQAMECNAFATFSLDETGRAQSIKMKGISPNIDFSFDFHDLDLKRVEN